MRDAKRAGARREELMVQTLNADNENMAQYASTGSCIRKNTEVPKLIPTPTRNGFPLHNPLERLATVGHPIQQPVMFSRRTYRILKKILSCPEIQQIEPIMCRRRYVPL
jgi:hypothetical protein